MSFINFCGSTLINESWCSYLLPLICWDCSEQIVWHQLLQDFGDGCQLCAVIVEAHFINQPCQLDSFILGTLVVASEVLRQLLEETSSESRQNGLKQILTKCVRSGCETRQAQSKDIVVTFDSSWRFSGWSLKVLSNPNHSMILHTITEEDEHLQGTIR